MESSLTLPSFNEAHVLVIGDVMLDRYWHGHTARISPEAPVPVVRVQDMSFCPGGAANVALNIAAIGAQSLLIGAVGQDREAEDLELRLVESGVEPLLLKTKEHATITKLRILSQNQQLIRLDFEDQNLKLKTEELFKLFKEGLARSQLVVLSDYAKGALAEAPKLIALAQAHGIKVLVDPKQMDFNYYRGADLITPNLKEFEAVVGPCEDESELVAKARQLLVEYGIKSLLVTRGREGMSLIESNGSVMHIPSFAREVYDVTGAGDTVIGILAASLAAGSELKEAVMIANMAAGLVVGKLGTATVTLSELQRALRQQYSHHGGLLSEEELLAWVTKVRAQGETIVMTNGCFDILHSGHVQYLQQAKALGDYLVVAVNGDDSVRRLKGNQRPLNSIEDRMQVLAALEVVDAVVEFNEDTPERLIKAILPDILVKGGDYQAHEIAGADAVMNNKGKVIVLDFKSGRSTTGLIQKILKELKG